MSENGQETTTKKPYYGELDYIEQDYFGCGSPDERIRLIAQRRREFDPDGKKALELVNKYHKR